MAAYELADIRIYALKLVNLLVYKDIRISTIRQAQFHIKDPEVVNTRLKNVGRQVYICVTTDDSGNHNLSTKTRKLESFSDPELDFSLYYYTGANATETKVVLPVHRSTNTCLRVTADKQLQIATLKGMSLHTNSLNSLEDPMMFTKADERFFYLKAPGSNVAFEAMQSGLAGAKHFLSVSPTNQPVVQEHNGGVYPDEILFSLDSLDNGNSIIY